MEVTEGGSLGTGAPSCSEHITKATQVRSLLVWNFCHMTGGHSGKLQVLEVDLNMNLEPRDHRSSGQ